MGLYAKLKEKTNNNTAEFLLDKYLKIKNLPSIFCNYIKSIVYRIGKHFDKTKRIFLVCTPEHGNLGDELIAVAEIEWLKKYYNDFTLKEFTIVELLKDKKNRLLLSQIKKDDLILFHGGGNVNNLYTHSEMVRRDILKKCPNNQIVLLQQSIYFPDTPESQKLKEETKRIYNLHKNYTIFTREKSSYNIAKELFPKLDVFLFPDMTTCLFNKIAPTQKWDRDGIVMCLRNDPEKFYTSEQTENLINFLKKDHTLTFADTHVIHSIKPQNRLSEVQAFVDSIAHHKLMITDRFHGVIFSILSRTPCIALRSLDHKIVDGVKWFKDVDGIFYADKIEDIPELMKKAALFDEVVPPDFDHYFDEVYKIISERKN